MIIAQTQNSTILNVFVAPELPSNPEFDFYEVNDTNLPILRAMSNGLLFFPEPPSLPQLTTTQGLTAYLDSVIFPFIKNLINTFAAENMAMGITQLGKTGFVLGVFTKKYDVNQNGLPISLKDTFDTGSLYESIKVIQHIRDNPTEFDGMAPFITDARLHALKNQIESALGIPLT